MRGDACFLAYIVGVSAVISFFIVSLMALSHPFNRPIRPNSCAYTEQAASRYGSQAEEGTHQSEAEAYYGAQDSYSCIHAGTREVLQLHEEYGYTAEPRRIDPKLFCIFGQTSNARATRFISDTLQYGGHISILRPEDNQALMPNTQSPAP